MITKQQALAIQQTYIAGFPGRLDALIVQAAQNGQTSLTVNYQPVTDGNANNFLNTVIIPAGWASSSIDTVAHTITVAP